MLFFMNGYVVYLLFLNFTVFIMVVYVKRLFIEYRYIDSELIIEFNLKLNIILVSIYLVGIIYILNRYFIFYIYIF